MLCLTLISTIIALAVARHPRVRPVVPMLDERIVGGNPTDIAEHPYQLSVLYLGIHSCGASIISTTKALTAARCTDGVPSRYLSVRAGSPYWNRDGDVIFVSSICQHPRYNATTFDNDVSVLRLSYPLSLGARIQPINLIPINNALPSDTLATVTGWGSSSSEAYHLQEVQVPRVSQLDCRKAYRNKNFTITDNMICFGYKEGGKGPCLGDYGDPLTIFPSETDGFLQVGIFSWAIGCALPNYPGVYVDLTSSSIRDHVDSC